MYKEITDVWVNEKRTELFNKLDYILLEIREIRTIIRNPIKVSRKNREESFKYFRKVMGKLADYYQQIDNFVAVNMIEEN